MVVGTIVLEYGFGYFLQGQRTEKRARGGSTSQQEFGLGATMKKGRSGRGRENVLQAPGWPISYWGTGPRPDVLGLPLSHCGPLLEQKPPDTSHL